MSPVYYVRPEAAASVVRFGSEVCVLLGQDDDAGLVDALTFGGERDLVTLDRFYRLWTPLDGLRVAGEPTTFIRSCQTRWECRATGTFREPESSLGTHYPKQRTAAS